MHVVESYYEGCPESFETAFIKRRLRFATHPKFYDWADT